MNFCFDSFIFSFTPEHWSKRQQDADQDEHNVKITTSDCIVQSCFEYIYALSQTKPTFVKYIVHGFENQNYGED